MKFFTKEVKIALVAVCGLVILFFGMNYLKGLDLFSSSNIYYVSFKDISGLGSSSPIYADGYKIGVVKGIRYNYDKQGDIIVEADIDQNMRIPQGSSAEIVSDMLGNVKVNLLLANNPRERVLPGDTILGGINGGAMEQLTDMVPVVMNMLPKLDSILCRLNMLLADPAIPQSLHNVQTITGNLTVTTAQMNKLLADLNKTMPGMLEKTNGILDNTGKLTDKLAKVDVEGTMAKVDATLNNVEQFTSQLNSNQGTLGSLMRDPSLYDNLTKTVTSADSLMIDIRSNPKRYVHFSVFGRKNK